MGNRRQWTGRSRGFTTMELITVIVITMIASTIAVAGYRIYQRDLPVKYAADRLARAMAAARSYAVANNSYYTVQCDRRYLNYWIDETDEFGTVLVPKVTAPEQVGEQTKFASFVIGGNVVPDAVTVVPLRFAPDGSCDDARITLQMGSDTAPTYYDVRIYGPTGIGRVIANVSSPAGASGTTPSSSGAPRRSVAPAGATSVPGRLAVNR